MVTGLQDLILTEVVFAVPGIVALLVMGQLLAVGSAGPVPCIHVIYQNLQNTNMSLIGRPTLH